MSSVRHIPGDGVIVQRSLEIYRNVVNPNSQIWYIYIYIYVYVPVKGSVAVAAWLSVVVVEAHEARLAALHDNQTAIVADSEL